MKKNSILLKVSGGYFRSGDIDSNFDLDKFSVIANKVRALLNDFNVAIVVGGGNICRGRAHLNDPLVKRVTVDSVGMLATVMNGLIMRDAFINSGMQCRVFSSFNIDKITHLYSCCSVREFMGVGVPILVGGTGNPYLSTDTSAAIFCASLDCDYFLKATSVDGVYDKDPNKFSDAVRYDTLSYDDMIAKHLAIIDLQAIPIIADAKVQSFIFSIEHDFLSVIKKQQISTFIN